MNTNTNKLRIRLGQLEVEYEGSEDFLKQELPLLLKTVSDLFESSSHSAKQVADETDRNNKLTTPTTQQDAIDLSTGSIAAKRSCKTGGELLLASAGKLTIVDRLASFSREELLREMQTASTYYKGSYSGNLTNYLKRAVKDGKLLERSSGSYALAAPVKSEMEKQLAV
jgi:hypothetical protein